MMSYKHMVTIMQTPELMRVSKWGLLYLRVLCVRVCVRERDRERERETERECVTKSESRM